MKSTNSWNPSFETELIGQNDNEFPVIFNGIYRIVRYFDLPNEAQLKESDVSWLLLMSSSLRFVRDPMESGSDMILFQEGISNIVSFLSTSIRKIDPFSLGNSRSTILQKGKNHPSSIQSRIQTHCTKQPHQISPQSGLFAVERGWLLLVVVFGFGGRLMEKTPHLKNRPNTSTSTPASSSNCNTLPHNLHRAPTALCTQLDPHETKLGVHPRAGAPKGSHLLDMKQVRQILEKGRNLCAGIQDQRRSNPTARQPLQQAGNSRK